MALEFVAASSQYLDRSWPGTVEPLTSACWFRVPNVTTGYALLDIADNGVDWRYWSLRARGDVGGDPVSISVNGTTGTETVDTTGGYSANTWHHACGVFAATNDRRVFLDGGNKNTGVVVSAPGATVDTVTLARTGDSTPWGLLDGELAEAAIWTAALTDAEVLVLARGYSPLLVRPQNLVRYWPLVRSLGGIELMNAAALTAYNAPTVADHPPIIYPSRYGMPGLVGAAPVTLRTLATLGVGR